MNTRIKLDLREQPNVMKLYLNLTTLKKSKDLQHNPYEQIKKDNLEDKYGKKLKTFKAQIKQKMYSLMRHKRISPRP